MKINNFKYSLLAVMCMILAIACSDSDKVFNEITDNVTRGAVLRQVNIMSGSVAINSATNVLEDDGAFAVLLEYQDDEEGSLLSEMEVYLAYIDNTDDEVDNNTAEILHETIPASSFTAGDRGFPQLTYTVSAQEMQSALGLSNDQLGVGGDAFTVRFELVLSDGRRFSNGQNSGTITGSYFASPFLNSVPIVCSPSVPTAGDWEFEMTDAWGDTWNGGALNVVLDGGDPIAVEMTISAAADEQPLATTEVATVNVPDGTQTISIMYSAGAFDEEVSFKITSANGNVVSEAGPTPPVGSELLDYCPDNL